LKYKNNYNVRYILYIDYQRLFRDILSQADMEEEFDEEDLNLKGKTFRKLMENTGLMVTQHYVKLENDCTMKWNFHSAFFFCGTVGYRVKELEIIWSQVFDC